MSTMPKTMTASSTRPTIGLLNDHLLFNSMIALEFLWGASELAKERDVNLICFAGGALQHPESFRNQGNIVYSLVDRQNIDGMLIAAGIVGAYVDETDVLQLCQRYDSLPVVSIGLELNGIPSVLVDNYIGMHAAVVHLIEQHACRRIAFICGPEGHQESALRYRAYVEALTEHDMAVAPQLVFPGDFLQASGKAAIHQMLDERSLLPGKAVDAIVAANDNMAISTLQTLHERGIRVPDDIVVVGFDDMPEASFVTPPLTTVRQPFHKMGRQAAELLLARIAGEDVPMRVLVPAELIMRRSCGCVLSEVRQAVVEQGMKTETQEHVLTEMQSVVESCSGPVEPRWFEGLLHSFVADIQGKSSGSFLPVLEDILRQVTTQGGDIPVWQNVLSLLRRRILPACQDKTALRAENLLQQARVVIGETMRRVQAYQALQEAQRAQTLREIGGELISTFDIVKLMHVLGEGLPRLDIVRCYLALYENPQPYEYPQPVPEWSRLILAYHDQAWATLPPGGQRFLSKKIVPEGFFLSDQSYRLTLIPLYFRHNQLGFVLLETCSEDKATYEALRVALSSALQGALLHQQVEERTAALEERTVELAHANEEIGSLNDMLKEENLRMSAELDISRRIQQMILPSAEELQQIEGLEIVGFMKPADELGGDYYDVLKEEGGIVHIGIGDVTGHGLESGVLMLMTQTAIRTLIDHGETDPVAFLTTLNRTLYNNIQRMGVDKTLTLAFVNYQNGQLKIVGQHEEMLVVRKNGQVERIDTIDLGFPLGMEENIADFLAEATITLKPDDGVVLYTDGITEAADIEGKLYGIERLCETVSRHWSRSAEDIKRAVFDDVTRHIGRQKVFDDLTLVVLKQH